MIDDLKAVGSHFAFGKNWQSYSRLIDKEQIADAEAGLLKLVAQDDLSGRTFMDIGCGSGIHSLAALNLGAKSVYALDLDGDSVEVSNRTLSRHAPNKDWRVEQLSILDASPQTLGRFDLVYSWGVLHHTGDMRTAVERAAELVKSGGLLVIALYRRTHLDWFWVREKRWYSKAPPWAELVMRHMYNVLFRLAALLSGKGSRRRRRGMEYWHDIHDWLGGYPYESIQDWEVEALVGAWGFSAERVFSRPKGLGLFGSGCDEYVFRKLGAAENH